MKNKLLIVSALLFSSFALTSCDTATGQGAGWGAATGAVLGAAATGRAEGAAVGALIGANTGAIIGASIDEAHAVRYGLPPYSGYPYARRTETREFYQSPYPPAPSLRSARDSARQSGRGQGRRWIFSQAVTQDFTRGKRFNRGLPRAAVTDGTRGRMQKGANLSISSSVSSAQSAVNFPSFRNSVSE